MVAVWRVGVAVDEYRGVKDGGKVSGLSEWRMVSCSDMRALWEEEVWG